VHQLGIAWKRAEEKIIIKPAETVHGRRLNEWETEANSNIANTWVQCKESVGVKKNWIIDRKSGRRRYPVFQVLSLERFTLVFICAMALISIFVSFILIIMHTRKIAFTTLENENGQTHFATNSHCKRNEVKERKRKRKDKNVKSFVVVTHIIIYWFTTSLSQRKMSCKSNINYFHIIFPPTSQFNDHYQGSEWGNFERKKIFAFFGPLKNAQDLCIFLETYCWEYRVLA
jgi:hypothetical protein